MHKFLPNCKPVVPKLRPTKTFYPARRALLKNICTHSEPQSDRIMSGISEENNEIRDRIKVKTFVFFSLQLSPEEDPKYLYPTLSSKSLGIAALNHLFFKKFCVYINST